MSNIFFDEFVTTTGVVAESTFYDFICLTQIFCFDKNLKILLYIVTPDGISGMICEVPDFNLKKIMIHLPPTLIIYFFIIIDFNV